MVMFAFGYAMIPFYKKICEVTGLNNLLQPDTLVEEDSAGRHQPVIDS